MMPQPVTPAAPVTVTAYTSGQAGGAPLRPKLTPLDERVLEHLLYIVSMEHRPACFRDFTQISTSHGTLRNSFSRLRKNGKITLAYTDHLGFYTLPSYPFVKRSAVTPRGMGARGGHRSRHNGGRSLYAEIKKLPYGERALHDLRLLFHLPDVWDILSTSSGHRLQPYSKDIMLPPFRSRDGRSQITLTVHHNSHVSVYVGCSLTPIMEDHSGVYRLGCELTRAEERLVAEIERVAKEASAAPSDIDRILSTIPDHLTWTCKSYHLGRDSITEYTGERFNVTYEDMQGAFFRAYSKQFQDKKQYVRAETLKLPELQLSEIVNGILEQEQRRLPAQ